MQCLNTAELRTDAGLAKPAQQLLINCFYQRGGGGGNKTKKKLGLFSVGRLPNRKLESCITNWVRQTCHVRVKATLPALQVETVQSKICSGFL